MKKKGHTARYNGEPLEPQKIARLKAERLGPYRDQLQELRLILCSYSCGHITGSELYHRVNGILAQYTHLHNEFIEEYYELEYYAAIHLKSRGMETCNSDPTLRQFADDFATEIAAILGS